MDRREEIHLDDLDAGALALLAAPAGDVEGEAAGLEAPHLGVLRLFEQEPDIVEHARESGRIRPRRPSDGRLVDLDELVDQLNPFQPVIRKRLLLGVIELLLEDGHERLVHEGGLAAAGETRHADEAVQRERYVDVLEVVASGAAEREGLAVPAPAARRHRNRLQPP